MVREASYRGPGQTGLAHRATIEIWGLFRSLHRPVGDLVFSGEPDAGLAVRVGEEAVENSYATGVPGNAVMQTHDHHPAPRGGLFVELVELILERRLVCAGVPPADGERDDI